jgi:IS1 family transposase
MKCNYCNSEKIVKKGKRGVKTRYLCNSCNKSFQDKYTYTLYNSKDDWWIKSLNANSVGIRSIARILRYSTGTILRRILYLSSKVTKPIYYERNQVYEVDELWTFVGTNKPSNYAWVSYAINRYTGNVIDIVVGPRTKVNLEKVIYTLKSLSPKKIITDKNPSYPNLIVPYDHDTKRYANNKIERNNLNFRTHLKRLSRKTICYSKSLKMLQACVLLYLDFNYWNLKIS